MRELGPVDFEHRGWQWSDQTDGGGSSLELMNAALPGEFGQNWTASLMPGGTPGQANSVATDNIAPMILKVRHIYIAMRLRCGNANSEILPAGSSSFPLGLVRI